MAEHVQTTSPDALAQILYDARAAGRTLDASDVMIDDLGFAYAVQRGLTAIRVHRSGTRAIGWKLGYTSEAMRRQMGVNAPNYGPVLASMRSENGAEVGPELLQPRVEPEVMLELDREIARPVDAAAALEACSGAYAALEVVDSVWRGYQFDLAHNTADGSSAAHVVVGPELPMDDLAGLRITMHRNGLVVGKGTGSAAAGHPAAALAWLANELLRHGSMLRRGDIVMTGGLTAAIEFAPNDVVHADFAQGSACRAQVVSVRRSRSGVGRAR